MLKALKIPFKVANTNDEKWRWKGNKNKTDKRDAHKLAMMYVYGFLPTVYMPTKKVPQRRSLINYRQSIVKRITQSKSIIRAILQAQDIRMLKGKSAWTQKGVEYLRALYRAPCSFKVRLGFLKKTFLCYFLLLGQNKTLYIAPSSLWENGYVGSFNSKLWGELLNKELFLHIDELRYVVDRWRMDYNHYRPNSSLDYMAPAAFADKCFEEDSAARGSLQGREDACEIFP